VTVPRKKTSRKREDRILLLNNKTKGEWVFGARAPSIRKGGREDGSRYSTGGTKKGLYSGAVEEKKAKEGKGCTVIRFTLGAIARKKKGKRAHGLCHVGERGSKDCIE